MLYTITLERMEFRAHHGCYDLEQKVGNRFEVDLQITTELRDVAARDAVAAAVNYLTVFEIVRDQMRIPCRTLERVADNIIRAIYAAYPKDLSLSDGTTALLSPAAAPAADGAAPTIRHIRCSVSKLAPPLGGKVERARVTLEN